MLDIILPVVSIGVIFGLYLSRKCDLAIFIAWWAGLAFGALWEFAFFFAGNSWSVHGGCHTIDEIRVCLHENPLPHWYISLAHSLEDAGIFLIGVGLAWFFLGGNKREHFMRWHWGELAIMWVWGFGSNYLVDFAENGRAFFFIPNSVNPAYFHLSIFAPDNQNLPYTIVPDAIWFVAPIIFYAILLALKRKWGGIYYGGDHARKQPSKTAG